MVLGSPADRAVSARYTYTQLHMYTYILSTARLSWQLHKLEPAPAMVGRCSIDTMARSSP